MRVGFFTDHDKSWFQTGKGSFFNPGNPDILMKSKVNLTVEDARNYCTIYQDQPSLLNLQKAQKEKRLKDDDYVLSIYYGANRKTSNFIKNVSFKKTSQPFLREARYANNDFGSLSLLANVYDLSFQITSPKAITALYPGNIINFILTDWSPDIDWEHGDVLGESDPHKTGTKANVLGLGGYYCVKSVVYKLTLNMWNDFSVDVDSVYQGNDGNRFIRRAGKEDSPISEGSVECNSYYSELVQKIKVAAEEWDLDTTIDSGGTEVTATENSSESTDGTPSEDKEKKEKVQEGEGT